MNSIRTVQPICTIRIYYNLRIRTYTQNFIITVEQRTNTRHPSLGTSSLLGRLDHVMSVMSSNVMGSCVLLPVVQSMGDELSNLL